MKDDFKAVVPSPPTPSRRVTPQQQQQQQQSGARRPSDTNNNANAPRGAAGSGPSAQPSPRAKAHTVKDNPSSIGTSSGYHAESTKEQLGSPTRHNATFITALAAVKPLSQRRLFLGENAARSSVLRPPSPLEAADVDRAREVSLSSSSCGSPGAEPLAANYVGAGALDTFWRLFHREETVNNHAIAAAPVPRPSSPVLPTTARSCKPNGTLRRPSLLVPLSDRPRSARSTYLAAVRKLHLTPEPLGIVRRRAHDKGPSSSASGVVSSALACTAGTGSPQEINLSSFCLGDAYTTALSESVALVPSVEAINLSHNRMSDAVAARLVANIVYAPNALQSLNLSHNTLGPNAARAIAELLQTSRSLTTLNLAHNALKDRDVSVLCDALQKNQTLQRIHLSENRFGVPGMVAIAKFLEENAKIEEVYLAWNNLRGLGALKIVEALKFHASIRVLDLSWNALDANDLLKSPRAIVTVLADALANNKVLTHLDLSNNRLDRHDCELLAAQLEQNHVLMGLHMSGNCGAMDSRGFLIPKDSPVKLQDQHKMYSIAVFEECMSESGTGVFPSHAAPLVDRFCWFCGQWSEHRFAWTPPAEALSPGASVKVKVHLCHDDWRGVEMEKRDDGSYSAYVVLPPGKTEYFFTVTDRATDHVSHHYMKEKRHVRRDHLDRASEALGAITYVNVLRLARRDGRDPCNTLTPRSTGKGTGERVAKWDINRSVFARRRRESAQRSFVDTDAFVAKACSADWRQCKVDRFVKDAARRKEVEVSVARHYRTIANVYRHFCGHNVLTSVAFLAAMTPAVALQIQNDIMSVPWSGYVEFLTECKILDETSEFCRYADCENVFVAANLELTQEAKEKDNPDRSLTRFEFMEAVIRIAINKFHRTNVCETPAKAVDKLAMEHLLPNCPDDPNDFRSRFLYTEEVSDLFSEHIVLDVYNSNMGRFCRPGEKKGMQLVEFLSVMETYQVFSDAFKVRDVKDPFLACKLVVLDEMATVGHKKLLLTDFMELLVRVAVLRYPPETRPLLTVAEVAKCVQKLFANHFLRHEALLEQFRGTVDHAIAQQRVEEFAEAISAQKHQGVGAGGKARRDKTTRSDTVHEEEETEKDEEEEEEEGVEGADAKLEQVVNATLVAEVVDPSDRTQEESVPLDPTPDARPTKCEDGSSSNSATEPTLEPTL